MRNVELYTSETCVYCHAAKEFLSANNIRYTEYNITKDVQARKALMKKGYMSVPLIIIDGKEIRGFDKEELSQALKL
ncbi:MAG: glutaredoxin [Clostridia bacterium]|jgi:glutaredoxin-like YruB-family protein|nr:glutaredoxin [Clostridia bacterium]MDF2889986.1 glutaredoxin [Clostridia bacterium]